MAWLHQPSLRPVSTALGSSGSNGIAASSRGIENNCLGTCEAHHVSISPEEDRRRSKSEVGEG